MTRNNLTLFRARDCVNELATTLHVARVSGPSVACYGHIVTAREPPWSSAAAHGHMDLIGWCEVLSIDGGIHSH